jgi:hypothetical protein
MKNKFKELQKRRRQGKTRRERYKRLKEKHNKPLSERERFARFLILDLSLLTTDIQYFKLHKIWVNLNNVRYPIAEGSEEYYSFTWNYTDIEGFVCVQISPEGFVEWYYRDSCDRLNLIEIGPQDNLIPEIILKELEKFKLA